MILNRFSRSAGYCSAGGGGGEGGGGHDRAPRVVRNRALPGLAVAARSALRPRQRRRVRGLQVDVIATPANISFAC